MIVDQLATLIFLVFFICAAVVTVAILLVLLRAKLSTRRFPYRAATYLLSKAERAFFGVLVMAVGDSGLVFAKVRMADVLTPQRGLNRSDWQRVFNGVSSKHFDFIICDPGDCSIRLAVELDDASHGLRIRQRRDRFLEEACDSAGLPLLRVAAANTYVVDDIRRAIGALGSLKNDEPASSGERGDLGETALRRGGSGEPDAMEAGREGIATARQVGGAGVDLVTQSPECPRCGAPMVRRTARSGANAGSEFWGCSTFPTCRGVLGLNT